MLFPVVHLISVHLKREFLRFCFGFSELKRKLIDVVLNFGLWISMTMAMVMHYVTLQFQLILWIND